MNSFWTECIKIRFQFGHWIKEKWDCRNYYLNLISSLHRGVEKDHITLPSRIVDNKAKNYSEQNVEDVIIAGGEEEVKNFDLNCC